MNILIALYKYFPYGGLQKDTVRVIREAQKREHKVTLLTTEWQGEPLPGLNIQRVPVRGWTNTSRILHFAEDFLAAAHQWPGVTLAMNRIPGADFYFAADSCFKKALPAIPGYWFKRWLPRYRSILKQEATVFTSQSATNYLLICQKQRLEFQECYPDISKERFIMLPPGIDENCTGHAISEKRRQELRQECGADGMEEKLLLTVGTNLRRKGIDRILSVLPALPPNVKFALAGNDAPETVADLLRKSGVDKNRFRFLGPRKDVADLLCAADLMVHPAREEGTGTVLLEAIACGLPVICTENCGFSPYVNEIDEKTIVPEACGEKDLLATIRYALNNLPALRNATRTYGATHDFTKRAAAIVDLLEKAK